MAFTHTCPTCGIPYEPERTAGQCPRCLLRTGLDTPPVTAPSTDDPAPTPEELAPLFPFLELSELIGRGGMGLVYRARQKELDRVVALKILPHVPDRDPAFAERFRREARALARLDHPHIVRAHDSGQTVEYLYFLMELVEGVSLRELMRTRTLAPAEAVRVARQVCDALAFAHEAGVIHRDIKPENILVDRHGDVKLADFGLARLIAGEPHAVTLTRSHQAVGTPHYMSPEQWEAPLTVDHRTDLYALGVVLYELLTGSLPIGRFDPPSSHDPSLKPLDALVLKALAKRPERRFTSATELNQALDAAQRRITAPTGLETLASQTGQLAEHVGQLLQQAGHLVQRATNEATSHVQKSWHESWRDRVCTLWNRAQRKVRSWWQQLSSSTPEPGESEPATSSAAAEQPPPPPKPTDSDETSPTVVVMGLAVPDAWSRAIVREPSAWIALSLGALWLGLSMLLVAERDLDAPEGLVFGFIHAPALLLAWAAHAWFGPAGTARRNRPTASTVVEAWHACSSGCMALGAIWLFGGFLTCLGSDWHGAYHTGMGAGLLGGGLALRMWTRGLLHSASQDASLLHHRAITAWDRKALCYAAPAMIAWWIALAVLCDAGSQPGIPAALVSASVPLLAAAATWVACRFTCARQQGVTAERSPPR